MARSSSSLTSSIASLRLANGFGFDFGVVASTVGDDDAFGVALDLDFSAFTSATSSGDGCQGSVVHGYSVEKSPCSELNSAEMVINTFSNVIK